MRHKSTKLKLAIFTVLSLFFLTCQEEENEKKPAVTEPLEVTYIKNDVSEYGQADGSIELTISGGQVPYDITWSNGQKAQTIDSLEAGMYIFIVSDATHTEITDTISIEQPDPEPLKLDISGQNITSYGANDGSVSVTVSGGVEPYRFEWSNGVSEKDVSGLAPGTYLLVVTDALGTSVKDSVTLIQPQPGAIILDFSVVNPSATHESDGQIHVDILGGSPPYSYKWSTGSDDESLDNLTAGLYSLTITDQSGQTVTDSVRLTDQVVDIEGNLYDIVKIGEQYWLGENLKVTKAPDGKAIKSFAYNDDTSNVATYSRLYTWDVAMNHSTGDQAQGICPAGWHIPSDLEFRQLEIFLGMTEEEANMVNTWRGKNVGTKLKNSGTSGYNAMMCGRRSDYGAYRLLDMFEYIWTSTEYGNYAWRRCLDIDSDEVGRWNTFPKTYAFSVRCIKDK